MTDKKDEKATVELHGFTFAMLPMAVVLDGDLPAGACRLAAYLIWRQGTNPDSWPGVPRISRELEVSERTVRRWRSALFDGGYISVIPRPGRSNLYRVHAESQGPQDAEEIPLETSAKEMLDVVIGLAVSCRIQPHKANGVEQAKRHRYCVERVGLRVTCWHSQNGGTVTTGEERREIHHRQSSYATNGARSKLGR